VFDLESGGVLKGCSPLTAFFAVCDDKMNIVDTLSLKVKPNDGVYSVTAEAMGINNINLIEHDKIAITYSEAGQKLRNFLVKNSDNGKVKLIPMGKNVNGDIKWVNEFILGDKTWNMYVSYRIWEVTTMALLAQRLKLIPDNISISLGSLVEYFNLQVDCPSGLHNEEYDVYATIAVNEHLIMLVEEGGNE
jgi:DNA polymerase III alpha subunit (gram-positive type)